MRPPRQAFTLFELILVLALLLIVGAIAYPSLNSMYGSFKVTAAADMVRSAWAEARARAINDGVAYRFCVVPGKGNFRVAPDSDDFWNGNDGAAQADPNNRPLITEGFLPKGVRFITSGPQGGGDEGGDSVIPSGGVDPSKWANPVIFLPDGSARNDAEFTLRTSGAEPKVLHLRGLTGVVTLGKPKP